MTRLPARPRSLLSVAALLLAGALLAGCETTGPSALAAAPAEPPMMHSRAAELCWMSTEKGATANQNLDKRADVVTKCIAEKMKGAAAPKG